MRHAARRLLRRGKYLVGDDRPLPLLLWLTPEGTARAITDDAALVIEGFPRSGTTFAVFALRNAEGTDARVVGHVHHPAQVKEAVSRQLPTLLSVRQPLPCLASYLVAAPHGRPAESTVDEMARAAADATPAGGAGPDRPSELIPLTRYEDMIVHSERRWPMTIQVEAWSRLRLDGERLARAVRIAMARHPLARVRRSPAGALSRQRHWEDLGVPVDSPLVVVNCATDAELSDVRNQMATRPLPLDRAPLLRVALARGPGLDVLLLTVHHGAFDGIGAVLFLASIGEAYREAGRRAEPGALCSGDPFEEIDLRVAHRLAGQPNEPGTTSTSGAIRTMFGGRQAARVGATGGLPGSSSYLLVNARLTAERVVALRVGVLASAVEGATLNDLLLCAHHLTLARWNETLGRDEELISVTVPVAAGYVSRDRRIVANLTDQANTTSRAEDRGDLRRLLAEIVSQTTAIKADKSARTPKPSLALLSHVPASVRSCLLTVVSVATRDRSVATSRLSNLGVMDRSELVDDLGIDRLWFNPPVRPPQGLNVGAVGLGGELFLSFRACRSLLDHRGVERFVELYLDTLASFS